MHTLDRELAEFTTESQFRPAGNGSYFGRYRGFPIGVSASGAGDSRVVLVHVRYLSSSGATASKLVIDSKEPLDGYLRAGMAEVTVEDGIAWLTVFDVAQTEPNGILKRLLDAMLNGLEGVGVRVEPMTCHYCQGRDVEELTFAEGRVAQICGVCLYDRIGRWTVESRSTKGLRRAIALSVPATTVSALIWCGVLWIANWISNFEPLLIAQHIVPHPMNLIPYALAALAACAPIASAIRLVPELGERPAKQLAGLSAVLALLLGELIRRTPLQWTHETFPIVLQKLVFAICLVCLSIHFCTKRKPTMQL